jgi:hypothetical protein
MKAFLVLAALACSAGAAHAQTGPPPGDAGPRPPTPPQEENTGQDITRPLTRVDLRLKLQDLGGGIDQQLLTLRADKPFLLGGGWQLGTRIDLPFIRNDAPGPDNPDGNHEVGLSDMLLQALLITPPQGRWTFAFGSQMLIPTATRQQFGTGKWQLAPMVAAVRQMPQISRGSFVGLVLRDQFSFAGSGSRANINQVKVQPLANFSLPNRWFITMSPEITFDTLNHWNAHVPFDFTIGRLVNRGIVASVTADVALIDDLPLYDWQVEFRIGFLF